MTVVPVPGTRVTFTDASASWPAPRRWYMVLFLVIWLGGWVVGEVTVSQQLAAGVAEQGRTFQTFWLAIWTLGGAFALLTLAWQLAGRESLATREGVLEHRRSILGLHYRRAYDLGSVANLRVDPSGGGLDQWRASMRLWGWGGGLIAFDYGSMTIRSGMGLDEPDARRVVTWLGQRDRRLVA